MKLQPRHFIAAPFLAVSGFLLINFLWDLGRVVQKDWAGIVFVVLFTSLMIFVPAALGYLALKRRWEEFVKIVAFFVLFAAFGMLSGETRQLAKVIESLDSSRTSFPFILWSLCVSVAPFVLCIAAYKRLVPLILRRIARSKGEA
jgi:hypothetical protein